LSRRSSALQNVGGPLGTSDSDALFLETVNEFNEFTVS